MFAVADGEQWKGVVFADGGYRAEFRMEMGKTAAAHRGQRTTALLAAIINSSAATVSLGDSPLIRPWLAARRYALSVHCVGAVAVVNYQDDFSWQLSDGPRPLHLTPLSSASWWRGLGSCCEQKKARSDRLKPPPSSLARIVTPRRLLGRHFVRRRV